MRNTLWAVGWGLVGSLMIGAVLAGVSLAATPASGEAAGKALLDSARHGEWVDIDLGDGQTLRAWVVYPERAGKAPVVLVIHEIFGLTDWVRGVADALAAEGFIAVAPDMLSGKGANGGGTESFEGDSVRAAIRGLDAAAVNARLDAAGKWAAAQPAASGKLASIGYCWGGTISFSYATHQPNLAAAVVYYGTATDDAEKISKIKAPVLGLYGGGDARVTSTVAKTTEQMKAAGKPFESETYENAGHGFLRQQTGREGANQRAADASWVRTVAFLKKHLEGGQ